MIIKRINDYMTLYFKIFLKNDINSNYYILLMNIGINKC